MTAYLTKIYMETCLNQTPDKTETCLNQTLNKMETCLKPNPE
jgi:hypothetical protein